MTRRRWIADEFTDTTAALTKAHAHHLIRVLRARVGQEFDIAAGSTVRRGRVTAITDDRVEFELAEEIAAASLTPITLLLAVFKFDRMEWAIEKCVELGVARIVPVIARRTDAHLAAAATQRADRWRRLATQASEQSRRTSPPEIALPLKLADAITQSTGVRIVMAESEQQVLLRTLLPAHPGVPITMAIGPEGGWTAEELEAFRAAGWLSASLGPTILRSETAAIAATVLAASPQPSE